MRVGIVGAGAIAHGIFALMDQRGYASCMWSPSGQQRPTDIEFTGVIETKLTVKFAPSAEELVETSDVIIFALPANGHLATMDAIAPNLTKAHQVIISSHLSFSALYLEDLLQNRGISVPIYAWDTTPLTSKKRAAQHFDIGKIRKSIDVFKLSEPQEQCVSPDYTKLFSSDFVAQKNILDIIFSNTNPQYHMGVALCNMTRMERGETWCQRLNITPAVGRLIEAMDLERLAVAHAYKCHPKSELESYGAMSQTEASLSDINQALHKTRQVWGPKTADTRYVLEDVPFGLWVMVKLGEMVNIPTPLHTSGVEIFSALYGKDLKAENTLLDHVNLASFTST